MRKVPTLRGARFKKAALWALLTTSTLAGTGVLALWFKGEFNITDASPVVVEQKHEASEAANSFALQFAHEYFKWTVGLPEQRSERLKPFLAKGMDPQAGLSFSKLTHHARTEQVTLWKTESLGEGKSVVTVSALVNFFDPEDQKKYFTKRMLLAVPVQEKSEREIAVIDNPRLIPLPEEPGLSRRDDFPKGERAEQETEKQIRAAAETFFKAYTTGQSQELSYVMKKPSHGFRGAVQFEDIEQLEVFKKEKRVISHLLIRMSDPETGMTVSVPYRIEWENQDGRWFVMEIYQ